MTEQTAATAPLRRLDKFVGVWDTTGEMKVVSAGKPASFKATDTYEWLAGGYFLLHHFDADMPDGNVKGIEVIGYDEASDSYPMHAFDSSGTAGLMWARVDNDAWTFTGEAVRFTGGFREDSTVFAGLWELRSSDGSNWEPWMEVTLRKVTR